MCLRIVSALRSFAMSVLAICCEYQTSDICGCRFFNAPVLLPPACHAMLVSPACVLRAGHCWGYSGCLPWSPHPPVAGLLRSLRNSPLPRNAQARPTGTALCPATSSNALVRSQAHHLAALLAHHKAKLPQPGIRLPLVISPQSQALRNKRAHSFRAATPLLQPLGRHCHPVNVIPLVADNKRSCCPQSRQARYTPASCIPAHNRDIPR
jgi:hypothetical protein